MIATPSGEMAVRINDLRLRGISDTRREERVKAKEKLSRSKGELESKLEELKGRLGTCQDVEADVAAIRKQMQELNQSITRLRSARDGVVARKAQAEERRRQVETATSQTIVVEKSLTGARTKRDYYEYLSRVFGPDEIQLLEIQSAGPGLSSIANALLEEFLDNKFEIRFRTQRPKADGPGLTDNFDIEVRNKLLDRTCLLDELSGGQFVLVNEALSLAIVIYNMWQGEGIRHSTLFRDETVGPLDQKNAPEYVRMLRSAMELSAFHQVFFICHSPQVWELADRTIRVHSGQVFQEA